MSQTTVNPAATVLAAVEAHRNERGPLLVILHEIQERIGFIPAEAIPLLADELNLSRADVHGVATFYHDFHHAPQGRVTVRLCRAEACASVGAEALVTSVCDELGVALGGTTPDGAVTVEPVFCLGNCALGPSAQVDGRTHGRVDVERVLELARGENR